MQDTIESTDRITLLTAEEAAEILRISPRTLENMRLAGTGPRFFKVGPGRRSRVVYKPSEVWAWLTRFEHSSTCEYTV